MRVCLVTNQFASPFSGVGTYARVLARGLQAAGVETTVLCPTAQADETKGISFISCDCASHAGSHARWLVMARSFARLLGRSPRFDVVHFIDAREALFYRGSGPLLAGTVHDYYFSMPLLFWKNRASYPDWFKRFLYASLVARLEPIAYRKVHSLIANSNATRARISAAYQLAEEMSRTIYIGLEYPEENTLGRHGRKEAVLFVGGNPYRKGLPRLMRAVVELRRRRPLLELWVVGAALPSGLNRLSAQLAADDALRVVQSLTPLELQALYQTARVFALPGITEAFGLVFLEAMASGCPVIGPEDGGAREIILHGKTGFLVPAGTDDLLVLRLSQFLDDQSLCEEFAAAARRRLSLFSAERMVAETLNCYETITA